MEEQTKDNIRYEELYQKAVARLLDKRDIDISEWLYDDEQKEFAELQRKLFEE